MDDFIFGSLSSDELRIAQLRQQRGGVSHTHQRNPRDPQPGQPVAIEITVGPAHTLSNTWIYWTNNGSDPAGEHGHACNGYTTKMDLISTEWDTLLWGYVRRYRAHIPPQPAGTVIRYRCSASTASEEIFADNGTYYACYVDNDPPPAWVQDAILYQIFTDRFFSSAADFPHTEPKPSLKCNGTLRGIIEKLDHIAALGVNCLWLTPVFPSPSYHHYDATSFFDINPRLGSKEDFKELLDQAHARGMRFIMDFVPNHWSNRHPNFLEATTDSESPFVKWYTFEKWPENYETFFGVKALPQINLRYPDARQHVLDAARYWLDFGVDGFRIDYCIGPTPDFYADFRKVTRAAKPDCWTFGEAIDPPDSQLSFEGGMDGTLDFILLEALRNTFAYGSWDARRFSDFLDRHEAYFPESFTRPSFLDNHDMNRFLWVAGNDKRRLKLAALCQYTLSGAPIVYYGTEVGLSQERDMRQNGFALHEEARLPMPWGKEQDTDLYDFYCQLGKTRNNEPALKIGNRETIWAEGNILAYRRSHGSNSLVSLFNLSEQDAEFSLDLTESEPVLATSPDCRVQAEIGTLRFFIPALSGILLKK